MLEPASRFFRSFVAAGFLLLLSPAVAVSAAPLAQPNTILSEEFFSYAGTSLEVRNDTLAVGAPIYGFVSLFDRNQGGPNHWGLVTRLYSPLSGLDEGFGEDLALSGDTLVVGKVYYPGFSFEPEGSAYIYERNQGGANSWGRVVKLLPSDPADTLLFGSSVALSGDTLAVAVGLSIFGSPTPLSTGAVYVFKRNQGGMDHWGQVRRVALPGLAGSILSISLSGDTLVAGASQDDGRATDAGAVYVFERNQGGAEQWGQVQKLTASDAAADRHFGRSVEISGDTIVVGAPGIAGVPGARAAYIFERGQGTWSETRKLTASDGNAQFGSAVAIDGDAAVVSAAIHLNPGSSAYVFRRNLGGPGQWSEAGRLAARWDLYSVSVSGNVAVLGNIDSGELFGPEMYVFDLAPLLITGDIPALGPFGLAAMALLLLAAGWWISVRRRRTRSF